MALNATQIDFLLAGVTDAAGAALASGKVYCYTAGTTTNKTIWEDRDKVTPAANPIVLDSKGTSLRFGDGLYKFVVKDSTDVTINTRDNVAIGLFSGPWTDVAEYASLTAAVTAIGSGTNTTLLINSSTAVTAATTITENIKLMFTRTGLITKTAGTLTINSSFEPVYQQIFSGFSTGDVIFGPGSTNKVYPEWWGGDVGLANTTAYNTGKPLVISQNYTLTANTTLTATVKVSKGGSFTKASTYTLAINGPIEIGIYQVFIGFSAGDITFGSGLVTVCSEWWGGGIAASAAVNSTAIASMIKCMEDSTPRPSAKFLAGTYTYDTGLSIVLGQVLKFDGVTGANLTGPTTAVWGRATVLYYTGTGTAVTLSTGNSYGFEWNNIVLRGTSAAEKGFYSNGATPTFQNVTFADFSKVGAAGLHVISSQFVNCDKCTFSSNYDGMYVEGNATESTTILLTKPSFHSNTRYGYYDTGSHVTTINQPVLQEQGSSGICVDYVASGQNGLQLIIRDVYSSGNNKTVAGCDIDIRGLAGTASAWMKSLFLENVRFGSRGASSLGELRLRNTRQAYLSNIRFNAASPNMIIAGADNDAPFICNIDNGLAANMIQDGSGNTVFWPRMESGDNTLYWKLIGRTRVVQQNPDEPESFAVKREWGEVLSINSLTEVTTIAAAATTDTAIQIPANVIVRAVSVRVTVAIPTAATFTVIGTTTSTVFNTAAVSTAANSTNKGNLNCTYNNVAAQTIRITPNLTPSDNTGRVRVTIWYEDVTPATD